MKTIFAALLIALTLTTTGCAVSTVTATIHHNGDVIIDSSKGKCFTAE